MKMENQCPPIVGLISMIMPMGWGSQRTKRRKKSRAAIATPPMTTQARGPGRLSGGVFTQPAIEPRTWEGKSL